MSEPLALECMICHDTLLDPVTHSCTASFCRACLSRWASVPSHDEPTCPACRGALPQLSALAPSSALIAALAAAERAAAAPARGRTGADALAAAEAMPLLRERLSLKNYAKSFLLARACNRSISLFVGPPNSGKTHAAVIALSAASSGAFLSPLRLLAIETRDALEDLGVPTSLLTGEDSELVPGAQHIASTVEMMDVATARACIVIDEGQMLFDRDRGWAWTNALLGAPCAHLIVITAPHAEADIRALLAPYGETITTVPFMRLSGELHVIPEPVSIEDIRPWDAIVSFSRAETLTMRDNVLAVLQRRAALAVEGDAPASAHVACVYGSLPSEVRRREAERFSNGVAPILCATDAIGQGLNLPIGRVLFASLFKFNGSEVVELEPSECQQIAGRAGRYGFQHEVGEVGILTTCGGGVDLLRDLLHIRPTPPRYFKAPIAAKSWVISTIARTLRLYSLSDVIDTFSTLGLHSPTLAVADMTRSRGLAHELDRHAPQLSVAARYVYACAPLSSRDKALHVEFLRWAREHAEHGVVAKPTFFALGDPTSLESAALEDMERAIGAATLWCHLASKFDDAFSIVSIEDARVVKDALADAISVRLTGEGRLGSVGPRGAWGARGRRGAGGGAPRAL